MYTGATSTVADFYQNEFDAKPTERINNNVLPHRIAWTAIYETPFGRGRSYVKDGPLSHVVGLNEWTAVVSAARCPRPLTMST